MGARGLVSWQCSRQLGLWVRKVLTLKFKTSALLSWETVIASWIFMTLAEMFVLSLTSSLKSMDLLKLNEPLLIEHNSEHFTGSYLCLEATVSYSSTRTGNTILRIRWRLRLLCRTPCTIRKHCPNPIISIVLCLKLNSTSRYSKENLRSTEWKPIVKFPK